jgi:hypothetical protein
VDEKLERYNTIVAPYRGLYRNDSSKDVVDLANRIRNLPREAKPFANWICWKYGLMRPRSIVVRWTLWLANMMMEDNELFVALFKEAKDDLLNLSIEQTALHVERGRDLIDKNSCGGWSQFEIDSFVVGMNACYPGSMDRDDDEPSVIRRRKSTRVGSSDSHSSDPTPTS